MVVKLEPLLNNVTPLIPRHLFPGVRGFSRLLVVTITLGSMTSPPYRGVTSY